MVYGSVERMNGAVLEGWAVDLTRLGQAAQLMLVIDGQPVGAFACTVPRPDVNAMGYPGLALGFRLMLPDLVHDGRRHDIGVRFRDGVPVPCLDEDGGSQATVPYRYCPTFVEGHVDGLNGITVSGWAFRTDTRTDEVSAGVAIEVWSNGVRLDLFRANAIRSDVAQTYGCPPQCGFFYVLPPRFRDGRPFTLEFRTTPEDSELRGSPLSGQAPNETLSDALHGILGELDAISTQVFSLQTRLRNMVRQDSFTLDQYHPWATAYYAALGPRLAAARALPRAIGLVADRPVISVVCPAYKPDLRWFAEAIGSVQAQTWAEWELLIVDDGSRDPALTAFIAEAVAADRRVRAIPHRKNGGISAATNTAIAAATGAYVAFFDHDDLLVPEALEIMVLAARDRDALLTYSDEDKIDEEGVLSEPHLKSDWNPRLLLSNNYVCHLLMVETAALRAAGPLESQYDGAQDHELVLRLSRAIPAGRIHHVAELLYHWRKTPGSTASVQSAKSYAVEAGRLAVTSHLAAQNLPATVSAPYGITLYSVQWAFTAEPSVAILIPFRDQLQTTRRCVETLLAETAYKNFIVVLIDNFSTEAQTLAWLDTVRRHPRIRLLQRDVAFNFSALNNEAARLFPAEFYVFMNNDVFVRQRDWLRLMVNEALADPAVAAVGIKLLYPDTTVQHGGVVLGVGGIADHIFRFIAGAAPGYCARAISAQDLTAVTAACMLCRADAFHGAGGFDTDELTVAFNDVDLCLKLRAAGYRIVFTPDVVADHHESLSRGSDLEPHALPRFQRENLTMRARWPGVIARDPHYNPNFSHENGMFELLSNAPLDPRRAQPLIASA